MFGQWLSTFATQRVNYYLTQIAVKSKLSITVALALACASGAASATNPVTCERYSNALVELVKPDRALPGVVLQEAKFKTDIRVGQFSPYITAVRAVFDLPHGNFDKELQTQIKQYQKELGFFDTGVIDAHTFMNIVPLSAEYREYLANDVKADCARIDKIVAEKGFTRYLEVNLASQNLRAFEVNPYSKKVTEILRTKVAVGGPNNRTIPQPHQITGLHINPSWAPGLDVIRSNLIPQGKGFSTDWLKKNHVDVTDVDGNKIALDKITPENWNVFLYRQPHKPDSFLGKVRFEATPNVTNSFLHDTPDQKLFERNVRLSPTPSIKVDDARLVAQWVAGGLLPESAESQSFDDAYDGVAPDLKRYVSEEGAIPVFFTYRQLEFRDDGTPVYFADIYDIRKPATLDPYHELDEEPVELTKAKAAKAKSRSKFEARRAEKNTPWPDDLPPK